ncbi:hypothetical protein Mgra_00009287 [Meloidogyne graminicola]|uniref:Lipase n=1 Tax=Meloidogyne graminicola TaxID=189291 RepID=A0A8S9Z875_9BILA|nr:hypothetical protein Mgra_00009287 [Meloidogyne graminicola]
MLMANFLILIFLFNYFLIFLFLLILNEATISKDFSNYLIKEYGKEIEKLIARRDLGVDGSFGGWLEEEIKLNQTNKRPIIFIHGLTNIAGNYEYVRRYFRQKGYSNSELYATTYSFGVKNFLRDKMECKHIKQLRILMESVNKYTKSTIDLVAFSMGSPMARKAVLGGICVDTGQYLGPPLTNIVHTFIGVAGANRDAEPLCKLLSWSEPCNEINGFSCNSAFLRDINSIVGYEAFSRISVIRSVDDTIVGNVACDGQSVSTINGQNNEIVVYNILII